MSLAEAFRRLVQVLCHVLFLAIPYGRRRRNRKPDFSGHVLLAPTHNNFFCDVVVAGSETPGLPRWFAKVGLFQGLAGPLLRLLGALPVVRVLDASSTSGDLRAINDGSFQAALSALRKPCVFCIFPEGNSLPRPGLNLPLKTGLARLAFAAESASDWRLGLRVIPLAIDYSARTGFRRGYSLRYGSDILVSDYRVQFESDPRSAQRALMQRVENELLRAYPHFESEQERKLADDLVGLGLMECPWRASLVFAAWANHRQARVSELEEQVKNLRGRNPRFPWRSLGYLREWQGLSVWRRMRLAFVTSLLAPVAILSKPLNFLPRILLHWLQRLAGAAEPDYMTLQVAGALAVLPIYSLALVTIGHLYLDWQLGLGAFIGITFFLVQALALLWLCEETWQALAAKFFALAQLQLRTGRREREEALQLVAKIRVGERYP